MRITRAVARNVKGFGSFDETFGDVTIFSGRNAAGKSTALDILCAAFVTDGGRDLLRAGAEEGEIRVYLEDEGSTFEIRRTITAGVVSQAKVTCDRKGRQPAAAAAFLKEIVDTATMDPVRNVMVAPPKEQMRILLETMPLDMEPEPVQAAVGDLVRLSLVKGRANLDTIKGAYDAIYAERTLLNRDAKTKAAHAEELRGSVKGWAAPEGHSWQEVATVFDQRLQAVVAKDAEDRRYIETEQHENVTKIKDKYAKEQAGIDAEIDQKVQQLQIERAARKLQSVNECAGHVEQALNTYRLRLDSVDAGSQAERDQLAAEKTKAQQLAQNEAQVARTSEIAAKAEWDAAAAKQKAARMTEALKKLDDTRDQLLAKLPIKGLKVEGGSATLNGVPLAELNTAEQAKFWIRVAVLRALEKQLGVVIIDHAECFDDQNLPLLIDACRESGLQFFIGRVAPHDFKIERYDSVVAA